jgi:hypothetical protein
MLPELEHLAQQWRLYRAFDGSDGSGGASRQWR